jgi:putative Mg2+ transporter-C (MgtC) family protein
MDLSLQEAGTRLILATILCGLIGVERELHQKPAGVRTNALVGLGSAVMTLCGIFAVKMAPGTTDPTRLASIVVQGIGFLGAGVIIQASGEVHGLTTAASMWLVAGIGIAVGFGFYSIAILTTVIALVLLVIFGPLDARLMGDEKERKRRGGVSRWFDKKG